ncbi:MAG: helix-turn-helix domain-containing protein [Eubacteriales bacterium]|nr:helix-turn-helix domain-containing protein [Eubacteriales bacterium]
MSESILISLPSASLSPLLSKALSKLFEGREKLTPIQEDIYLLELSGRGDVPVFKASFPALKEEISPSLKALLLPLNDPHRYLPFLSKVEPGQFESLFFLASKHPEIYQESFPLLEGFDDDMLETVEAYLENSSSPLFASYSLYVHRNTVTYRIKTFEERTGFVLDDFSSQMFLDCLIHQYFDNKQEIE